MKCKKITSAIALVLLIIISLTMLTGCGKKEKEANKSGETTVEEKNETVPENNTTIEKKQTTTQENNKTFEEKKVTELSNVDWDYEPIDFSKLKWLNTEKYGNICIPNDWEVLESVQAIAYNGIVYGLSDASQTIIMEDCSGTKANDTITALLSNLSADITLEEWSYETKKLSIGNAVIVSAKFNTINHVQSTMFIASPDKSRLITISVEAADPNVVNLLKSFTFNKSDKDAVTFFESAIK